MKPAALRLRMAATNAPTRRLEVSRQSEETADAVDNQDLFHQMDTDKSGSLSPEELREELRKQGDEPEDEPALVSVFTAMDADGDGAITYAEAEAHEFSMVRLRAWLPASALVQLSGPSVCRDPKVTQQSHPYFLMGAFGCLSAHALALTHRMLYTARTSSDSKLDVSCRRGGSDGWARIRSLLFSHTGIRARKRTETTGMWTHGSVTFSSLQHPPCVQNRARLFRRAS